MIYSERIYTYIHNYQLFPRKSSMTTIKIYIRRIQTMTAYRRIIFRTQNMLVILAIKFQLAGSFNASKFLCRKNGIINKLFSTRFLKTATARLRKHFCIF